MLKLSVLDQSPVRAGGNPRQALEETITLAQATENLGYSRYWLAEHHGTEGFAGSSPEILVTRVAAATNTIRVGSGGVMLSHYSPLKVAENFKLLENLYPGRIDLGIGRAPGSDGLTAAALAYGSEIGIEYFPTKIADMMAFLSDEAPASEPFKTVRATPSVPQIPEVWLLGSSDQSAAYAAHFGLAYTFAHFITPQASKPILDYYRANFKPSDMLAAPQGECGRICDLRRHPGRGRLSGREPGLLAYEAAIRSAFALSAARRGLGLSLQRPGTTGCGVQQGQPVYR